MLELGSGDGEHFRLYPETVTELVAIEPEENLRQRSARAAERASCPVRIVPGFAEKLPAADGEFDAAVAALVLCSVSDQQAALAELMRVVRRGGGCHIARETATISTRPLVRVAS